MTWQQIFFIVLAACFCNSLIWDVCLLLEKKWKGIRSRGHKSGSDPIDEEYGPRPLLYIPDKEKLNEVAHERLAEILFNNCCEALDFMIMHRPDIELADVGYKTCVISLIQQMDLALHPAIADREKIIFYIFNMYSMKLDFSN